MFLICFCTRTVVESLEEKMATGLQLFYQTIYLQLFLVNEVKEVKGISSETDFSDRMQSYITANMLMLLYAVEYPFILLYYFKGLLHVNLII